MKLKSTIQLPIRVMIVGVIDYEKDHIEDVFSDKNGFDLIEMIGEFDRFTKEIVIEKIRNLNIDVTFVDRSIGRSQSIGLVCGINIALPDTNIIVLCEVNEVAWVYEISKCGVVPILNKPIEIDFLNDAMNVLLGKSKA